MHHGCGILFSMICLGTLSEFRVSWELHYCCGVSKSMTIRSKNCHCNVTHGFSSGQESINKHYILHDVRCVPLGCNFWSLSVVLCNHTDL